MFGREKTPATAATLEPETPSVVTGTGKGRPTPKRKVAEQANRRPVVAAPRSAATKEERKQIKAEQRDAARAERVRTRAAIASGDERYLPARDQGAGRKWARQYVDARRNPSEYFLPIALFAVVVSLLGIQAAQLASMILLYGMVIIIVVDLFLLRRRVQKRVDEKFPSVSQGVGTYAMLRALQMRRGRIPRPTGERGEYPA